MKTIVLTMILSFGAAAPLFAVSTNALSDEKSRISYSIGISTGTQWKQQEIEVNYDMFVLGLKDAQSGSQPLMTDQEIRDTLNKFKQELTTRQQKKREEAFEKNKAEGEAFMATNKNNPGVVTLPSGLQYKVITDGNGPIPTAEDIVTVNYRGTLVDGTEFDSSFKKGNPAQLRLKSVIRGWSEALTQMKTGSKWQLFVPPDLGYGKRGRSGIPPNSILIFEVELLSIQSPPPPVTAPSTNPPLTSDIIKVPSLEEMNKGAKIEVIKPEEVQKLQQPQPGKH